MVAVQSPYAQNTRNGEQPLGLPLVLRIVFWMTGDPKFDLPVQLMFFPSILATTTAIWNVPVVIK